MRAWLFQDSRQKQKLGDDCPWSVGWYEPDGKKKSKRIGSHSNAEKYQRKIEGQLAAGTYESATRAHWSEFMAEFESKELANMDPGTREVTQGSLNHFERIIKPVRMQAITSKTISDFVAARRAEPKFRTRKKDENGNPLPPSADAPRVSPATVNRDLRVIRATLRIAVRWGYLAKAPQIEFLREAGKLPTYVTPEHFAALYQACDSTRWPADQPFTAADWWRGLLIMAYMTGWRIGSLLALRWQHVDLTAGTAVSLAENNKGKRDQIIRLHPLVIDHLRKLKSFSPVVFPWSSGRRSLYTEFGELQRTAKVQRIGGKGLYGFHDLRRAFATLNAGKLSADALQALMQHKDYQTTQRYINMANQLVSAVDSLYVPQVSVG